MESPKENKVPPQDQECKGPSQDHRPRTEDNVNPQTTSTVIPKYPATQKVRKVEIEYHEERANTIARTIAIVPDKISIQKNQLPQDK